METCGAVNIMLKEMKFYHLTYDKKPHVYLEARFECPPVLEGDALDTWLETLFGGLLLPTGDSKVHIRMKSHFPENKIPEKHILDTYTLTGSPPFTLTDYPKWLENLEPDGQIDRWLLIGEPTVYGHLFPIRDPIIDRIGKAQAHQPSPKTSYYKHLSEVDT